MANTINLANSSFTDVDLDCTVSKESWCLLLVKNHLISQAKTFTSVLGLASVALMLTWHVSIYLLAVCVAFVSGQQECNTTHMYTPISIAPLS